MGCNASKGHPVVELDSNGYPQDGSRAKTEDHFTVTARTAKSLAFEVPLRDAEDDLIRKHPPKRFQRLEDQQMPPLTHRLLDEKQAEAEQRRMQILNQRIQSAKARQKLKRTGMINSDNNGLLIESLHREPSTVEL